MCVQKPKVEEDDAPMLVIGAGFGRTGTSSLKAALEILYQKPCYHMGELIEKHPDHVKLWTELYNRMERDGPDADLPKDIIRNIFCGYQLTTDNPGCTIYKQLMRMYPEAKVILTVRNPKSWLESLRETVRPKKPFLGSGWISQLKEKLFLTSGFIHMTEQSISLALGQNVDLADDEQLMKAFVRRNEDVKHAVPSDRLLIFRVEEGWNPLCQFLGKPIPTVPFPHLNDRESMQKRIRGMQRRMHVIVASGVVLFGVVLALGVFWCKSRNLNETGLFPP